jgi:hypothetical protein
LEVPLPYERLLWSGRALSVPATRYALTDLRLVRTSRHESDELIVQEIDEVHRRQSPVDRLLGTSTIIVERRGRRQPPFVLARVRQGAQLAALLELLSSDPRAKWDPDSVRAALAWEPADGSNHRRTAFIGLGSLALATAAIALGWHSNAAAVIPYPSDDAIYPQGVKRDPQAIVRFMESDVLPWAGDALAPIKGNEPITCETCHGSDGETRAWQMPAVAALPEPYFTFSGWEIFGGLMDAQMRNAIYGYTAGSENQTKAAYMREVIMPGMARLLHRPAYDFTRTYDYNRRRSAFGCYHCHRVR